MMSSAGDVSPLTSRNSNEIGTDLLFEHFSTSFLTAEREWVFKVCTRTRTWISKEGYFRFVSPRLAAEQHKSVISSYYCALCFSIWNLENLISLVLSTLFPLFYVLKFNTLLIGMGKNVPNGCIWLDLLSTRTVQLDVCVPDDICWIWAIQN